MHRTYTDADEEVILELVSDLLRGGEGERRMRELAAKEPDWHPLLVEAIERVDLHR